VERRQAVRLCGSISPHELVEGSIFLWCSGMECAIRSDTPSDITIEVLDQRFAALDLR
jgi:hypothetical protein